MAAFQISSPPEIQLDASGDNVECIRFYVKVDNHGVLSIPICNDKVTFSYNAQEDFTNATKLAIKNQLKAILLQVRDSLDAKKVADDIKQQREATRRSKLDLPIQDGDIN